MAIIQGIVALISRSLGRILSAAFGWAVVALFGETSSAAKMWLSGLVAAAAAWPILLLGVVAPKVSALALAFVPIPPWVPSGVVRAVWIALALIVPMAIGLAMAIRRPTNSVFGGRIPPAMREAALKRVMRGFPITIGLAVAFLIVFVTVPTLRIVSFVRRRIDLQIPLVTDLEGYESVADEAARALSGHGFPLSRTTAPWWMTMPSRVLLWADRASFRAYVPRRFAYYRGPRLEAALYPNGLLVRGTEQDAAWAHGILLEALTPSPSLQTFDPQAQGIEKQIRRVWQVYRQDPVAHQGSRVLLDRLGEIADELGRLPVAYDEWQIVYRQALQLGRALKGESQLLDATSRHTVTEATMDRERSEKSILFTSTARAAKTRAEDLSTRELVAEIARKVSHLVKAEVDLAKTEVRENLAAELAAAKAVAVAIVAAVVGLSTLSFALVIGVAHFMAAWLAAVVVGGVFVIVAVVIAGVGWSWHVKTPLAKTRQAVKENVEWAKERVA
jgi:uncharacterized membrane protein YqjE